MELYRLDQVCKVNPPKEINEAINEVSFIPMEAVSTNGETDLSRTISVDKVKNYSVFKNRDVLFAKITPCMENGKGGIVDSLRNGYGAGSTEFIVIRPDESKVLSEWIQLFLSQTAFRMECRNHMTGSAGQKRVPPKYLAGCELPVPPLHEQRRIVARIEELFSELDNSVSTLQKTKSLLGVYRQAVLKEAFDDIESVITISELCNVVRGGSPRPAGDERYYNGRIPFLKVADLTQTSGMYLNSYTYTIKEAGLQKTRMVPANTLLLTNSGATLGVPKICTFETTMNDGIAAFLDIDTSKEYLPYHYYYWLSKTIELRAINQGAAQPNLNTTIIGSMYFPHCSYKKQVQLSTEIESRLSICDSIEHTVDATLQKAEAMRQSILKQAFEGRL